MPQVRTTTLAPEHRGLALATAGGLIVVGGPPFHGKSVLAARLADALPFAHKLEVVDNLAATSEYWDPTGLMARTPITSLPQDQKTCSGKESVAARSSTSRPWYAVSVIRAPPRVHPSKKPCRSVR